MRIMKSKWKWAYILCGIVVLALLAPVPFLGANYSAYIWRAGTWLVADPAWDSVPKIEDGVAVFDTHYSLHAAHHSLPAKIGFALKIDVKRTMDAVNAGVGEIIHQRFAEASDVGAPAPDFDLETTDGDRLRLSDLRGKVVAFQFAAMTCPPARTELDRWTVLNDKYDPEEVVMLNIYSAERHAGEPGYRDFTDPTSYAEKFEYAKMLSELTDMTIAVDSLDEAVLKQYGPVANPGFVVDQEGNLVFKTQWADATKIEKVVDTLLEIGESEALSKL